MTTLTKSMNKTKLCFMMSAKMKRKTLKKRAFRPEIPNKL